MDKGLIYQIGRLDPNFLDNLKFSIDSNYYETSLTSFAIKQYYKEKSFHSEIILLYPQSLVFNRVLINKENFKNKCPENFWKALKNAWDNTEEYLKNPHPVFQEHPHTKQADDFLVIYSLGEYETSEKPYRFKVQYEDIVLMILVDMIERYLADPQSIKKIIVDISSGHNPYINALLEAIRHLDVWAKLYNICEMETPKMEVAFSDPIIGTTRESPFNIYLEKTEIRTFFASPIKYGDIENNTLAIRLFPQDRQRRRIIKAVFENFAILFSAVKNGIPLAVYHFGYDDEEQILQKFKEFIQAIKENFIFPDSPNLNKDDYIKTLLVFGFYLGLIKLMKKNDISKNSSGVSIEEMKHKFSEIYEFIKTYKNLDLFLNETILKNEIDIIQKKTRYEKDFIFKPLSLVLYPDVSYSGSNILERNFFAHAGFEINITMCKKEKGKVYLKYDFNNNEENMIKNWLKKNI